MQDQKNKQQVAIITGANSGIGFETALGLARKNFIVILACRTKAKGKAAAQKISQMAPGAQLVDIQLDLINRPTIEQFVESFKQKFNHLDVLINNAGVMGPPYTITGNDLELQLDANHMGHFYLTSLLYEYLDQDFETRIINVSSLAGKRMTSRIHFDNINFEGTYDQGPSFMGLKGMGAYGQSKLANILFTMELKRRLEKANKLIKPIVVHPGISNTNLSRNFPWYLRFLIPAIKPFLTVSNPADGAKPSLFAALHENVQAGDFIGPTGKGERVGPPGNVSLPAKAQDVDLGSRLWDFSEKQLGLEFRIE